MSGLDWAWSAQPPARAAAKIITTDRFTAIVSFKGEVVKPLIFYTSGQRGGGDGLAGVA
jgi:hypothetical protein